MVPSFERYHLVYRLKIGNYSFMFGITRFSQLLTHLPKKAFKKIVAECGADKYLKKLKSWDLITIMLYGQLTQAKSLRTLVNGFSSHSNEHYHLNTQDIKRSTLSDALAIRSIEPFKKLCEHLMNNVSRSDRKKCKEFVSIIDSSPIQLKGYGYSWTEETKNIRLQGLKLHLEIDSIENAPTYVNISASNINDITDAKNYIKIKKDYTYVVDKGYFDFNWWYKINLLKAYFVTRTKSNTAYKVVKELEVFETDKEIILSDEVIHLTNKKPRKGKINKYANKGVRLVTVIREGKKPMPIITNDFKRTALEIAELYKRRWQIELFFKWIKQKLKLKSYFGQSKNAVIIQIYCALISYLLMRLMSKSSDLWKTMLELQTWLQHGLFVRDSINTFYYRQRKQKDQMISSLQLQVNFT